MIRGFAIGCALTAALMTGILMATPFPSPSAQLDLDGNCAVNFPGDTITHAKIALGLEPVPTGFPTCRDWYDTPTPEATSTP